MPHENYHQAFTKVPMLRYLVNGVIVTSAIFALQVLVAVPCAYALAKLDFGPRAALRAGAVRPADPGARAGDPALHHAVAGGLLNTYAALVIPFVISVFGIFLMRQFFKSVPDELIHAARLDGLSEFSIVWRIMVPAAMPALISFGIFSVVAHWNDYFWPLLVINSRELAPPPLGVAYFRNEEAGHRLRPADGRRGDHHRAAGRRLPARAAPFHRRHDDDRAQGLTTRRTSMKSSFTAPPARIAAACLAAPACAPQVE